MLFMSAFMVKLFYLSGFRRAAAPPTAPTDPGPAAELHRVILTAFSSWLGHCRTQWGWNGPQVFLHLPTLFLCKNPFLITEQFQIYFKPKSQVHLHSTRQSSDLYPSLAEVSRFRGAGLWDGFSQVAKNCSSIKCYNRCLKNNVNAAL